MRVILLVVCVSCISRAMAQHSAPGHYMGEWWAVVHTKESKSTVQISISKDSISIRFDSVVYTSTYSLQCATDSCMLTMLAGKTPQSRYVLTPIDQNAFYWNTLENHTRYQVAKQARQGTIAWGWSDPRPIRFERQLVIR